MDAFINDNKLYRKYISKMGNGSKEMFEKLQKFTKAPDFYILLSNENQIMIKLINFILQSQYKLSLLYAPDSTC